MYPIRVNHKTIPVIIILYLCFYNSSNATNIQKEEYYKAGLRYLSQKPQDKIKALKAFKKSCIIENKEGCFHAGLVLTVESKYREAKKWFEQAYKLGHLDSAFYLGDFYYFGNGIEKNLDKAIEYYQVVCSQPNNERYAESYFSLAQAYTKKNPPNYKKAVLAYRESCSKQYKNACFNLGNHYYFGRISGKNNYTEAKKWLEIGSNLDSREASYRLGVMYMEGNGVEEDIDKSISYFLHSEKLGFAESAYNLGVIYVNNDYGRNNLEKTQIHFEKALDLGISVKITEIKNTLATLYLFKLPQMDRVDWALSHFEDSIQNERSGLSALGIGLFHENANGIYPITNIIKSLKYHYIAKELGEPNSAEYIPALKYKMTPKQISEARKQADEYMKQLNAKDTP